MIITAGVPIGREGPSIHIGGAIGHCLSHIATQAHNMFQTDKRKNTLEFQRKMVLYGASAGFACAFRAPMGGVLYAIEELCTQWDSADYRSNGAQMVLTTILSVLMLIILFAATRTYSSVDYTSIIISQYGESIDADQLFDGNDIIGFLVTGAVCGVSGGILTHASLWFINMRKQYVKGAWKVLDTGIFMNFCFTRLH